MTKKLYNTGIVNYPGGPNDINYTPLKNLLKILKNNRVKIYIILGEREHISQDKNSSLLIFLPIKSNINLTRIINYFTTQIKISCKIINLKSYVNLWFFFIGGDTLLFPILVGKILRKKVVILSAGSSIVTHQMNQDKFTFGLKILRPLCLMLADKIIVYTPRIMQVHQLDKYKHKIIIAHRHFLDFDTFKVTIPYKDRPNLIGYIGRLSGEKGVQHFAQALPTILSDSDKYHLFHKKIRVLIGGDGQLKESIDEILRENDLNDRVDLPGWISHEDLPSYLNQLRLLVLPSYTEGLPNIMLEAMACGTPVLATPAGAIPDVIINGKTGFIMENNSPECIAENVARALACPELEEIAEAGRRYVEEEYRFEKVVERWREILTKI